MKRQGGVHPEFGKRLRLARELRSVEQGDFARTMGVSQATVSRWETSDREPSLTQIENIAEALRLHPAWLVGWRKSKEP